jgi:hypothetical protein
VFCSLESTNSNGNHPQNIERMGRSPKRRTR